MGVMVSVYGSMMEPLSMKLVLFSDLVGYNVLNATPYYIAAHPRGSTHKPITRENK